MIKWFFSLLSFLVFIFISLRSEFEDMSLKYFKNFKKLNHPIPITLDITYTYCTTAYIISLQFCVNIIKFKLTTIEFENTPKENHQFKLK